MNFIKQFPIYDTVQSIATSRSFNCYVESISEQKQGDSHFITGIEQGHALLIFNNFLNRVVLEIPSATFLNATSKYLNHYQTVSFVALVVLGAIRGGNYSQLVDHAEKILTTFINLINVIPKQLINKRIIPYTPQFSRQLNPKIEKACNFINNHAHKALRVAFVVSSVAVLALANYASVSRPLAINALFNLTFTSYSYMKSKSLVPHSVRIIENRLLHPLSAVGLIFSKEILLKISGIFELFMLVSSNLGKKILYKVDKGFLALKKEPGPSLKSYEKVLPDRSKLTFEEINRVLDTPSKLMRFDPAHCSVPVELFTDRQQDRDFEKILQMFDSFDWMDERYHTLLMYKLKSDENFISWFVSAIPNNFRNGLSDQELIEHLKKSETFFQYLDQYLETADLTRKEFAVNYARKNLEKLVQCLKGSYGDGCSKDMQAAMDRAANLIYHFNKPLELCGDPVKDKEITDLDKLKKSDFVIKMAVEAGDYCPLGIRRCILELHDELLLANLKVDNDPLLSFESLFKAALLNSRDLVIQNEIMAFIKASSNIASSKKLINYDVHFIDELKQSISVGFLPPSKTARYLDIFTLIQWELTRNHSNFKNYCQSIKKTFIDVAGKESKAFQYICLMLQSNPTLSKENIQSFEDMFIDRKYGDETFDRFINLYLYKLGIMKLPKS